MSDTGTQPLVFLACVLAGLVAGVIYRLLQLWCKAKPNKWILGLCDALFVIASGGLFFTALYLTDYGRVRLYTILAFLGGFALLNALWGYVGGFLKKKRRA